MCSIFSQKLYKRSWIYGLHGSISSQTAVELRHGEVRRIHHGRTSGSVKLHSWISALGQQGTEAEPGRLGVLRLTYPLARHLHPAQAPLAVLSQWSS